MCQAFKKALGIPTTPEKTAKEAFRCLHPHQRIAWCRLAADESDRFVVSIFYGDTRPPSYAFYAVAKSTAEVTPLDDDSAYRPKVWR
jgi:nicotinic acid mononucleotide adenylyltransferase